MEAAAKAVLGGPVGPGSGTAGPSAAERRETERENLGVLWGVVSRALLEMVMKERNRLLAPDARELTDAFVVVERVLRHGLRPPPLVSLRVTAEAQLWAVVQRLGAQSADLTESVACVGSLGGLSSPLAKVRAWLRLGLMQKKLGDYVGRLTEAAPLLEELYEDWAFLRSDAADSFAGSLLGLRVIDSNLCLGQEELLAQPLHVRLAHYIRLPTLSTADDDSPDDAEQELKTILDQKNFLEEHNLQLQANIVNLEKRIQTLEQIRGFRPQQLSPKKSKDDPPIAEPIQSDGKENQEEAEPQENAEVAEVATASEEVESLRAMIAERQDSLLSLRAQMEDVKRINQDLYAKLRTCDETRKRAESEAGTWEKQLKELEAFAHGTEKALGARAEAAEAEARRLGQRLAEVEAELGGAKALLEERSSRVAEAEQEAAELRSAGASLAGQVEELEAEVRTLRAAQPELVRLRGREVELETRLGEYEETLVELGVELSGAKLGAAQQREGLEALAEAAWERDTDVRQCKACTKDFGLQRRRHHCRNCGSIFCGSCSEQTMPLPSFPKPQRVCDPCYALLLARFSKPAPS